MFPSTVWSVILAAADPDHPDRRTELENLIRLYWKPVYVYIRSSWNKSNEDSKDLTQSFLGYLLLEKNYLSRLRPTEGSFRGYLKRALKHYLIDAHRSETARKPEGTMYSLDVRPADWDQIPSVQTGSSPEFAYDREWFRGLLQRAIDTLRDNLQKEKKDLYYQVLDQYCLAPMGQNNDNPMTYEEIARKLNLKVTDVRNYLTYSRAALRTLLRESIREYTRSEEEMEQELGEVLSG